MNSSAALMRAMRKVVRRVRAQRELNSKTARRTLMIKVKRLEFLIDAIGNAAIDANLGRAEAQSSPHSSDCAVS